MWYSVYSVPKYSRTGLNEVPSCYYSSYYFYHKYYYFYYIVFYLILLAVRSTCHWKSQTTFVLNTLSLIHQI